VKGSAAREEKTLGEKKLLPVLRLGLAHSYYRLEKKSHGAIKKVVPSTVSPGNIVFGLSLNSRFNSMGLVEKSFLGGRLCD
jgi:hypothetical protein